MRMPGILRLSGFGAVAATDAERAEARAGDALLPHPDVVMDRGFTVPGAPDAVWPWVVQLGKARAGWYLPARIERWLPRGRRALDRVDAQWQGLQVGDVVSDYGGAHETFTVAEISPPSALVYTSRRGRTDLTWSITLHPADLNGGQTRVLLRLRLHPVRRVWLARSAGEWVDALTVLGLAGGLRERLAPGPSRTAD